MADAPDQVTDLLPDLRKTDLRRPDTEEAVELIMRVLKHQTHRPVTRQTAKALYEALVEYMFTQTAKNGSFRLPTGWGSFVLKIFGKDAKPRRLPSGEVIQRKPRPNVRYVQGSIIRQMFPREYDGTGDFVRARERKSAIALALGEE